MNDAIPAGATPAEWARLACSDAAPWALPVQCNPAVPLSPRSSIKAAGKLPSIKNAQGQIAGIPGWTTAGPADITRLDSWSRDPDAGFCVRTGHDGLIAIDADIDTPETAREDVMETFPVFSADGKYVYYCAAPFLHLPADLDRMMYALVRVPFDAETGTLGAPADTVWSAAQRGKSVCHPKASPDGRWLLFTLADYGTFPINHRECDLCLMDLATGAILDMTAVNSDKSDTYHSWSSDARWFVFASKRGDGLYGKPWFSHVSPDGTVTRPFLLPQKNPHFYDTMLRSFNVPDLGNAPVGFDALAIESLWKDVAAEPFE